MSSDGGGLIAQADAGRRSKRGVDEKRKGVRGEVRERPRVGDSSVAGLSMAGADQHVLPGAEIILQVPEAAALGPAPVLRHGQR